MILGRNFERGVLGKKVADGLILERDAWVFEW